MKRKIFVFLILITVSVRSHGQNVSVEPEISPALFQFDDEITVKYDVTGSSLANLTEAFLWVWIPGKNIDAKFNINPATTAANSAKLSKTVVNSKTIFSITFRPSDFFDGDISAETQLGMLLKGKDWSNGQTTDFIASFWDGSFQIKLTSPTQQPIFLQTSETVQITAETPVLADFDLLIDGELVTEQNSTMTFSYTHTAEETSGSVEVKLVATSTAATAESVFNYVISSNSPTLVRPNGIISGINYNQADDTKVTLCLLAPGKTSVYVRGDFSNWSVTSDNLMYKDGEYFWIELTGLTPGQEYAYQYIVDETLFLADPYSDKILDPDDRFIPANTYPNLKTFPQEALQPDKWYFNRLSVFQTGQSEYEWQVENFERPKKQDLVIYELHIRDFFADGSRNYQTLIDTISYFKRLGVNAIELMPIMEFAGNDSWGYNPTFMFAPDKYYGTKEKLKEFIDRCHQAGIAVILDIAMNHQDTPNPYILMDFNFGTFKPNPTNPWFNVEATHPFSVFFDMNHESEYTQAYLDTVNYYWLKEYNIDGYRFDLSKGFTQNFNTDVGAWSAKDDSRIALLKRMADKIREHFPDAYLILEHLSDNSEETILSDYGFMLWGNLNHAYSQNSMGFASDSDLGGSSYKQRGWSEHNLIAYMESHDEERMMFRNITSGNSAAPYSVKNPATALERIKAAATFYLAIPGPKMIWQFGELGYDVSIDFNGRTGQKPVKWEYYDDPGRKGLFNHFADMIALKKEYKIFETEDFTIQGGATLTKQLTLKNSPYTDTPSSAEEMNVQVAVNFDVVTKSMSLNFPHTGKWYDYISGEEINVESTPLNVAFLAGEYALYTDVKLKEGEEPVTNAEDDVRVTHAAIYPNPSKDLISINSRHEVTQIILTTPEGFEVHPEKVAANSWRISNLAAGLYIVNAKTKKGVLRLKLIKQN